MRIFMCANPIIPVIPLRNRRDNHRYQTQSQ